MVAVVPQSLLASSIGLPDITIDWWSMRSECWWRLPPRRRQITNGRDSAADLRWQRDVINAGHLLGYSDNLHAVAELIVVPDIEDASVVVHDRRS